MSDCLQSDPNTASVLLLRRLAIVWGCPGGCVRNSLLLWPHFSHLKRIHMQILSSQPGDQSAWFIHRGNRTEISCKFAGCLAWHLSNVYHKTVAQEKSQGTCRPTTAAGSIAVRTRRMRKHVEV